MLVALDVGGTKLLAAPAGPDLRPGAAVRRDTPREGALEALTAMVEEVRAGGTVDALALAVPGPFDRRAGALVDPPNMSASWHGLPIREALGARFGCPVVMENDANCAALAEARHGAGAGRRTVVYYTVSTGIGSGVVRDGRLHLGRNDTEGGHQVLWPQWLGGPPCHCGGHGCLETLASGLAIRRRFGADPEHLEDPGAWDDVGRWLGLAVVNSVALWDPDAVVLGGGVCAAWDKFWPSLTATIDAALRLQPRPAVVRATLGEDRNLWGALALLEDAGPA